jgi:hypothetical protein
MGYTVFWNQLPFSDFTYENLLKLAPKVVRCSIEVTEWGFILRQSKEESACIERRPTQMTYVKTNRLPYTKDLMKVLILMVEYGAAENLGHDDTNMEPFLAALNEVHAIHKLVSYDMQKGYFIDKQYT